MNRRIIKPLVLAGLAVLTLSLGGCSFWTAIVSTDAQAAKTVTVQTVLNACKAYRHIFEGADAADVAYPFPADVVKTINDVDVEVEKVCPPGGHMPVNLTDGLVTVVNGAATITTATTGH